SWWMRVFIAIFLFAGLNSCKENDAVKTEQNTLSENTVEDPVIPVKPNINKDRDIWQKPSIVLDLLGDLSDKTVADIGAGTGYFTFRIALKAQKVIAIDIDTFSLELINTFKRNLPPELQGKIETRLADPDDPQLEKEETDIIVIINTISEISERKDYLKTLLPGLKKGGKLVIVDYKLKKLPIQEAPPQEQRVPLNILENELAQIGYDPVISDDTSLDYQYIVFAHKK
ncbi:MAG TPA: class I SAM-dependent methyltransferase, partial [Saprospiraceae bacterium]|nr:class I SAM-dependent methyltransferase [Saprospiraceae bacterium]